MPVIFVFHKDIRYRLDAVHTGLGGAAQLPVIFVFHKDIRYCLDAVHTGLGGAAQLPMAAESEQSESNVC